MMFDYSDIAIAAGMILVSVGLWILAPYSLLVWSGFLLMLLGYQRSD
jgi:hypothetical protein